jgi:ribosomal protein S12 methylthiotransferase
MQRSKEPVSVAVVSLGCVKNIIDTEVFLGNLAQAGFIPTQDERLADMVLVNTCSFIDSAAEESLATLRELVARAAADRGSRKVVAVGCMVQRFGGEIFRLVPGLAGAVSLDDERELPAALEEIARGEGGAAGAEKPRPACAPVAADTARLRITPRHYAYLRLSEGCSTNCTFCIIPTIRGRLRSKPRSMVLAEARELIESGARELILVAQDLTAYGHDLSGRNELAELLAELETLPDLVWIRLLYLHPAKVNGELVDRIAGSTRIVPCIDLSFQHVSTPVLKRMGRGMTADDARNLVRELTARIPRAVLRGTFLVGFPGETEEDFETLVGFIKEAGFPRGGVFRWSPQEGTPAARLEGRVAPDAAEHRQARVRELLARNAERFNRERIGTTVTAVIDEKSKKGLLARSFAETPDVDPVIDLPGGDAPVGSFVEVTLTRPRGLDLVGKIRRRLESPGRSGV